jgi:hypothetical protein
MMRTRAICAAGLVGALLLVLSGCGSGSADDPSGRETDWPQGRNDLVLRMQTLPGMSPPHAGGLVPDFSMYGDGTVVVPASDDSQPTVVHLDSDTVGDLLTSAVTLVDDGEASDVAGPDAPVVNLTFIRDGVRDQASLDGTDSTVSRLRQQLLDAVADAQP